MKASHEQLKQRIGARTAEVRTDRTPDAQGGAVHTAVPAERLRDLDEQLLRVPDGFTVHPKLVRQLERRRVALDEGGIDWGQAEALAFATLLTDGIPVRLTGQDSERGTFSNRHLVLHDAETDEVAVPMQRLDGAQASFEVHNSPLSEYGVLGFEYGYSIAAPESLVLWEAQYGDFVNGAQVVIDQFIVAGLSKWKQTSRLTLLLPHGYEGNGPEHSSARLERFLSLAAQENVRIANVTTAAQYFHLLRRQALDAAARPLIVMTPKGLLRLKAAGSTLADLAEGEFQPVLRDDTVDPHAVRRLVLVSGKLYYDLVGHEARAEAQTTAVARVEQLYPFPVGAGRRARPLVPLAGGGRVGAGGAAEHGRLPRDPAPARGRRRRSSAAVRRPALACEPERGLPHGPPGRAGHDHPRVARRCRRTRQPPDYGSRWRRRWAASRACVARRGPCLRAAAYACRRCASGSRCHSFHAVSAIPKSPARGMRRGTALSCHAAARTNRADRDRASDRRAGRRCARGRCAEARSSRVRSSRPRSSAARGRPRRACPAEASPAPAR